MTDLTTGLAIGGAVAGLVSRFTLATFQGIGGMKSSARSYIISGLAGAAIMGGIGYAFDAMADQKAEAAPTVPQTPVATKNVNYIPR